MIRTFSILHQGALGDFLLALPALEGLHRLHPDARFNFLVKPEFTAIIAEKPYFGGIIPHYSSALTAFYQNDLLRGAEIPPFFLDADASFIFGQDSSRVLTERLSELGLGSVYWIRSFPPPETRQPVTGFIIEQLQGQGWPVEAQLVSITPSQAELRAAKELLGRMGLVHRPVLIHPGSGGQRKVWPLENWLKLIHYIIEETRLPLMMTLGPADGFLSEFAAHVQKQGIPVITSPSLAFMTALLSESEFYIGNDSGISHLASAVGIPGLVFFGPTDPTVWAPRGPGIQIVQDNWSVEENLIWSPESHRPLTSRITLALRFAMELSKQTDRYNLR